MLESKAELFSAAQAKTFMGVLCLLILSNAAAILGWIRSYFKRRDLAFKKMKRDLDAAFLKIRALELKVFDGIDPNTLTALKETQTGDLENGTRDTLQE